MDIKLKNKWIKALLSGKYHQGQGDLKRYDYNRHRTLHCCLGVLGEVAGLKEEKEDYCSTFNGCLSMYDYDTLDVLGLLGCDQNRLAEMNDGNNETRKSFRKIAAWIKENVK